ncbi:MAG: hypothetical protein AB8B53_03540 [Flavobacteriales bacterium]
MSNNILFVFEGGKTEDQIFENLAAHFLAGHTRVHCAFCADIYQFYTKIYEDEDLDTFSVLSKRIQNVELLSEYKRSDFAEIYMFFDYDGHAPQASDKAIIDMLKFFNEETEAGKLFISYPMVEALKHVSDPFKFKDLCVFAKKNIDYKKMVHNECLNEFKDLTSFNELIWSKLIELHLKKMTYITDDQFIMPSRYIEQLEIFQKQLEKHIIINSTVSVLSAVPIFLCDYYGFKNIANLESTVDPNDPNKS